MSQCSGRRGSVGTRDRWSSEGGCHLRAATVECRAQGEAEEGGPSCPKGGTDMTDRTQQTELKQRQCLQGTGSRNCCGVSATQSRSPRQALNAGAAYRTP